MIASGIKCGGNLVISNKSSHGQAAVLTVQNAIVQGACKLTNVSTNKKKPKSISSSDDDDDENSDSSYSTSDSDVDEK